MSWTHWQVQLWKCARRCCIVWKMLSLLSPFYLVPKLDRVVIGKGRDFYVNAASRVKFESVCNFSLCLWERWLFHNKSLPKVAAWLRGEGRALGGNTVGGCAVLCCAVCAPRSPGEPPSRRTGLLRSSARLEVWRGGRWAALVRSTEGRQEWKRKKNEVEELWVESLLRSPCELNSPQRKAKSICRTVKIN